MLITKKIFINDAIHLFNETECDPPSLTLKTVGCLFYADDLVILSTSEAGLQKSLNKLDDYCQSWKLSVNYSKSKVLCFSRQGKKLKETFTINGQALESVQTYTYLGLEISSSGKFINAQNNLCAKAIKATFKLKKLLSDSNLNPDTKLKLFDQLITLICLYGVEVWGPDCLLPLAKKDPWKLEDCYSKFLCEKINISYSKFTLGVHKKSTNNAVRGELGRYPLGIDGIAQALCYHERLEMTDKDSLLGEAFRLSKSLNPLYHKSWGIACNHLIQYLHANGNLQTNDLGNLKITKRKLRARYNDHWQEAISKETKMRTYLKFKNTLHYESYLNMNNQHHQKAMTRFRISAHTLAIERGRYTIPKTPLHDRKCGHCTLKEIEDEHHFLLECPKYEKLRDKFESAALLLCTNLNNLSRENKFIFLMSAEDKIANITAHFIYDSFLLREKL